jgi:hypothetical protein
VTKVTLATSSGLLWLTIASHFALGMIALVSGTVALSVAKGGQLHKKSGIVFSLAMILTGLLATAIYVYEGKVNLGGLFIVYLIFTAVTTVKTLPFTGRALDITLMILAFGFSALTYIKGVSIWQLPGHALDGVPAGMMFFLATIGVLAGVGDLKIITGGPLRGARRIARHLWRMCFGLFIATGSFFFGQMKFIPQQIRWMPLISALGVAPLVVLLYWMWRVRLRRKLTGLVIASGGHGTRLAAGSSE